MHMDHRAGSNRWILGMSGASGTVYARTLVREMITRIPEVELEIVCSDSSLRVMREEERIATSVHSVDLSKVFGVSSERVRVHNNRNIGASIASGSYPVAGMVILPCSMATVAAVASGLGDNLIRRAADVTLKEGRRLIVVPRETPLSMIQLENLLTLSRAGAMIVPAMPGFYHQPQTIQDLVDMMVEKVADLMGYQLGLIDRWKSDEQWPVRSVPCSVQGESV